MRGPVALLAVALAGPACHLPARAVRTLPPLGDEGELHVYLDPLPLDAARIRFSIESAAAVSPDGVAHPLDLVLTEASAEERNRQRLLAWGRLAPGDYRTVAVKFKRATVQGGGEASDLLVSPEPTAIAAPLAVARGRATVVALALEPGRAVGPSYHFTPAFTVSVPSAGLVPTSGYCSNAAMASVTVFDKHARRAVAVFPVGTSPTGVALDPSRNRAFVALAGDDQLQVVDLLSGTIVGRVMLRSGDRPRDVALTPDGRQLLVINEGSSSLAFVDAGALLEVDRVETGLYPNALLLDAPGRRAYVLSARSTSITIVDVVHRAVVRTLPTEAAPVHAQLSRAGDRLYVALAGSPHLPVYSVADLTVKTRLFVGLGATTLKVDPRTDLLFVGAPDDARIQVFDPLSVLPISSIELPAGTSWMTVDGVENALVALLPARRSVVYVDLASRRLVGEVECGFEPYQVTVFGER